MLGLALLAANHAASVAQDIDACVAAHARRTACSVSIRVSTQTAGSVDTTRYRLEYIQPRSAMLSVVRAATGDHGATNAQFFVSGDDLTGLDNLRKEYLQRSGKARTQPGFTGLATLEQKLGAALPLLDDVVQDELDANALKRFLAVFRSLDGWENRSTASAIVWRRDKVVRGKQTHTILEFDRSTHLLRRMSVGSGIGQLTWTIDNHPTPRSISLRVPRGYKRVDSFVQSYSSGQFPETGAKAIIRSASEAMNRLRQVSLQIEDADGSSTFWRSGRRLRYLGPRFEWTFDGKQLRVVDLARSIEYSGHTRVGELPDALAKAGATLDPLLWRIASTREALHSLLGTRSTARTVGTMGAAGNRSTIVEVDDSGVKTQVEVMDKTKLVRSMSSTVSDKAGHVIERSSLTIKYLSIDKPLAKSALELRAKAREHKPLAG